MEHRRLGAGPLEVGVLSLGTMTFGVETDEDGARAQLDAFVAAGGNLVDTADVYGAGRSEEIVGRWIADRGGTDGIVLATKGRFPVGDGSDGSGASASYLRRALEASLRRLGVDSVDLYQVHGWDPATPVAETVAALDAMVTSGKVRTIGLSNYTGWQLQRALRTAEAAGTAEIVALQAQYNLLAREIEWELLPQCLEEGVSLLPWSPLGGGWLTGKYARDHPPSGATRLGEDPDRGVEAYDRRNTERTWDVLDALRDVAADHGVSMGQAALAWVRDRPAVASVVLGARTVGQLEDNLGAADVTLDPTATERLSVVSAPGIADYPYRMLARDCGMTVWDDLRTRSEPD